MIRTTLSIAILTSFFTAAALAADPAPKKTTTKTNKKTNATEQATPARVTPVAPSRWSLTKGVWIHPDGYKFVNGRVVRTTLDRHKPVPKPPTPAELEAAKKQITSKTAAESAAKKEGKSAKITVTPRAPDRHLFIGLAHRGNRPIVNSRYFFLGTITFSEPGL